MKRKDYQKKSKPSKKRLAIKVSLLVTLSAFLVIATYAATLLNKAEKVIEESHEPVPNRPKSDLRVVKVEPAHDNISILFIGVDDSEVRHQGDSNSRSDALLFATLNPNKKSVKLVSIPRDSYVYIPEVGYHDKITHAHAFGGTKATIETVEEMFDIPVDYYVKMNFNAFIDVVDALGGIEAEVPYDRIEKDENDKYTIHLKPGLQHLDGKHALALARTRKLDSDVERGKRQQMILQSIMKEAVSVKSITKYGDVIEALGDNMKTDMTFKEITALFEYANGGMPQVDAISLKGDDWWKEYESRPRVYFWKLDDTDLNNVKDLLKAHLGIIPDSSSLTDSSSSLTGSANKAPEERFNN
ncbi:LCP family protein [Sporosarcina limicola]|uniref:LCP family protein required for cell wall assembly n=1 Tax=Sporosarcina limicola TaxID=34101 RepID=A0A927MJA5_9BACL|nr:LCP family protein [Sporosarcina limicola]MBE1554968.1 LCP family protein required for cell wall assembly [Sporosarcina limicola]